MSLLIMSESGDVVLVEARPDRHVELARMTAFSWQNLESPGPCHTLSVSAHG